MQLLLKLFGKLDSLRFVEKVKNFEGKKGNLQIGVERVIEEGRLPNEKMSSMDLRSRIIMELVETEASFVNNVSKIIKSFYEPLEKIVALGGEKEVTKDDISVIFSNIAVGLCTKKRLITNSILLHDRSSTLTRIPKIQK